MSCLVMLFHVRLVQVGSVGFLLGRVVAFRVVSCRVVSCAPNYMFSISMYQQWLAMRRMSCIQFFNLIGNPNLRADGGGQWIDWVACSLEHLRDLEVVTHPKM